MADPKKTLQEAVRVQREMVTAVKEAAEKVRIEREKAAKKAR